MFFAEASGIMTLKEDDLRKPVILCLIFMLFGSIAYCGQESRIELADGSVINGEIVSYADGVYSLNTRSFGMVNVESSRVSRITPSGGQLSGIQPAGSPSASTSQVDFSNYQQKIMSDPASASLVTGMAFDPSIQALAEDPQIQEAVKKGDIQALMQNEKFMSVVNNPKMQESIKKLKK